LLQLQNVLRQHRSWRRVHHEMRIDLVFDRPEVVAVFGPNGAGKSTLLDLMAGRVDPQQGRVQVHGHALQRVRRRERRLLVHHLRQPRMATRQADRFEAMALNPVDWVRAGREMLLDAFRGAAPAGGPRVYLFDEPPLEPPYGGLFIERYRQLRAQGHLVLFTAHPGSVAHLQLIGEVCDRCLFVDGGRAQVFDSYAAFLREPFMRDYLRPLNLGEPAVG
jgi:ABC-type multidrug transport system ATPase subunit